MTIIKLAEYQPPTRQDQFAALRLLIDNVDEPWVARHVATRLNQLAADVVDASDREPAQVLRFPQPEASTAGAKHAMRRSGKRFVNAVPPREAKPEFTLNEVFHRLVENQKDARKADNFAEVRAKALKLHATKGKRRQTTERERLAKKRIKESSPTVEQFHAAMVEFRKMVLDTALPPDLQRLEVDMRAACAERPWINRQAQKRASKPAQPPDEGSIGRAPATIVKTSRKPRKAREAQHRGQTV